MLSLIREFRFALRSLRRRPGFALVSVLTLALAIGACTAIYSVVYGVLLQALPYPAPNRIVQLWQLSQTGSLNAFSDPNFEDLRDRARSFQAVAEFNEGTSSAVAGRQAVRARTASVSRDFFDVVGIPPARGRRFAADELSEGAAPVVIVSYGFWQRHFAGAADLASALLRVRGKTHIIVGVMPPGFDFPAGVEIWFPREATARNPFRTGHNWRVVARLKDEVTLDAARAEATSVARQLKAEYGDATWMTDVAIVPLHQQLVGDVRRILSVLLAAVALLLTVACANLSNLVLARVSSRQRELGIRSALGAKGPSLVMPFLAESAIVGAVGGALGVVVAVAAVAGLRSAQPANLPRLDEVHVSWPVLAFAFGVTVLSTTALGLVAAWRARRPDIVDWLKDGHGAYSGGAVGRLRSALIVAQLAVAVILLVGAGLLGRSLFRLMNQDPGFRSEGLLAIDLASPQPQIRPTPDGLELGDPASLPRQARLNERLIGRLGGLPGVAAAGGISRFPMSGGGSNGRFLIVRSKEEEKLNLTQLAALADDPARRGESDFRVVSSGYFAAMGIPLLRGRLFDERDGPDAPHVAVISESLVRKRWPNEDPIGLRIQNGGMDGDLRVFTIIGVVGDVRDVALDADPLPTFYGEYRQRPLSTFTFTIVLQTAVPAASMIEPARTVITREMPEVPPQFRTIEEVIGATVAGRRLTLAIAGLFAAAAMLLAALGLYGVLSYLIAQRQHEFGIRMALGARAADVSRLVLGESARLVGFGLGLGLAAAFALNRVLRGMLFGIGTTDPLTYVLVASALSVLALLACQVPALRATRTNPLTALRSE